MPTLYDISLPISCQTAVWPGDPPVVIEGSDNANGPWVSRISLGSHTGTHVDPPAHFIAGGPTVDQLPLDVLIGRAWVSHLPGKAPVTAAALAAAGIPAGTSRLLLRTDNSQIMSHHHGFDAGFVALESSAAGWLLARGIRLVGIDALSIEPYVPANESTPTAGFPVHHALLDAGVVIVEGLMLAGIAPGEYQLICLPLRVAGGDGAPARAVLIR